MHMHNDGIGINRIDRNMLDKRLVKTGAVQQVTIVDH